jgi:hypothetical protein
MRRGREHCRGSIGALIGHLFLILVLAIPSPLIPLHAAQAVSPDQTYIVESMMRATAARFDNVEAYTRLQHYSASDDRFGLKAELLVRIHYDHVAGKTFEIVRRSGSPIIQSRVFDALLQEEVETSKLLAQEGSLLTTHNYSFRLIGQDVNAGRPCYLLELNPLRKDKHLIRGRVWVDKRDFGIVHIEGSPAESLSFWIGKPVIVQDFEKLSGFWFAARRNSVMNGLFIGRSELTVDYSDYEIRLKLPGMPRQLKPE